MTTHRYLIVGGGMTGDAACKGIRSIDPDGSIALVGDEPDPPYARPPLTKGLWLGKEESSIWRGTEAEGVELHLGRTIVSPTWTPVPRPTSAATRTGTTVSCSRQAGVRGISRARPREWSTTARSLTTTASAPRRVRARAWP